MSPHTITLACAAPHKGKRAIELSLHVAKVNEGLGLESLSAGLQLAACVRSIEDHGFLSMRAVGLLAARQCKCSTSPVQKHVLPELHALYFLGAQLCIAAIRGRSNTPLRPGCCWAGHVGVPGEDKLGEGLRGAEQAAAAGRLAGGGGDRRAQAGQAHGPRQRGPQGQGQSRGQGECSSCPHLSKLWLSCPEA